MIIYNSENTNMHVYYLSIYVSPYMYVWKKPLQPRVYFLKRQQHLIKKATSIMKKKKKYVTLYQNKNMLLQKKKKNKKKKRKIIPKIHAYI